MSASQGVCIPYLDTFCHSLQRSAICRLDNDAEMDIRHALDFSCEIATSPQVFKLRDTQRWKRIDRLMFESRGWQSEGLIDRQSVSFNVTRRLRRFKVWCSVIAIHRESNSRSSNGRRVLSSTGCPGASCRISIAISLQIASRCREKRQVLHVRPNMSSELDQVNRDRFLRWSWWMLFVPQVHIPGIAEQTIQGLEKRIRPPSCIHQCYKLLFPDLAVFVVHVILQGFLYRKVVVATEMATTSPDAFAARVRTKFCDLQTTSHRNPRTCTRRVAGQQVHASSIQFLCG